MHLLVIGINYAPENTSVAPFTTGLCEDLIRRGHRVSMITAFPYYPQWRIYDGYRGKIYQHETIQGVDVRRVIHFVPTKPRNLFQRLLHDVTFSFNAWLAIPFVGKVDGIYCACPPPFLPSVALFASRLEGVPFAIFLTDLASHAAVSLGIMSQGGFFARIAGELEKFNYRRAKGISVLGNTFKDELLKMGVEGERIFVVPTWADVDAIRPLSSLNEFRRQRGVKPDHFLALHSGNMGLKQGLQTVVEASVLADHSIQWMLVGDGEEKQQLENIVREKNIQRIQILPLQPQEKFPFVLAAADVFLLVQRASMMNSVMPSKLLTYMAAGRPIVASINAECESALRIRDAGCGIIVPPENPAALAQAVQQLRENPDLTRQMGANGRQYVERLYSKQAVLAQYAQFIEHIFLSK
jgi:colanic acid biosynthesis glycosyl transferase WcaI